MNLQSFKDFIYGPRKYVGITCDPLTHEAMRNYCITHGFDLTRKFNGDIIKPDNFSFHTTIFFSTTRHKELKNKQVFLEKPIIAKPSRLELFGEMGNIPVLRVESDDIIELREYFEKDFEMGDEWPSYKPHTTLSYNFNPRVIDITSLPLPNFNLYYDKIKVKNIDV